ncbi:hypothetical protein CYMTET_26119 [Cymbomonas tetramitiformis]|uniref:CRAL-TRIO domain-containing protein n=1 Tax=Cymbomonas tetramitiformis TaxID=36881 RepID=A0AAE0FSH3_9CHLO|nr:hypothetical protein CYMTET_26119 [Cymbomonas tetramitiformis]
MLAYFSHFVFLPWTKAIPQGEKGEEDATVHANKRSGSVSEECEHRALAGFKQLIVGDGVEIPLTMIYAGDYDATLLRFLRARKLNLEKSFAMLKESIEYRKSEKFDTVLLNPLSTEKMDILRKYSLGAHSGTDRQGRPIYFDRPGFLKVEAMLSEGATPEDFLYKHVQEMEYMGNVHLWSASLDAGHTIDQTVTIIDVTNISPSSLTKIVRDVFGRLTKIDQNNYPESLAASYIVNASWIFTVAYKVRQHLRRSPHTRRHAPWSARGSQRA